MRARERDAALERIRDQYGVPAKFGQAIYFQGVRARIAGVPDDGAAHLIVRVESGEEIRIHPTWSVEYPVKMFRCVACGKWSHNTHHKPKHHERLTSDEVEAERFPHELLPWSGDPEEGDAWKLQCGPFETYEARRDHYSDRKVH